TEVGLLFFQVPENKQITRKCGFGLYTFAGNFSRHPGITRYRKEQRKAMLLVQTEDASPSRLKGRVEEAKSDLDHFLPLSFDHVGTGSPCESNVILPIEELKLRE